MKVTGIIEAQKGEIPGALRAFLSRLIEAGVVDYLLLPRRTAKGKTVTQTLVKGSEHLDGANPFSPVMAANSAAMAAQLSRGTAGRVGVVLKPCEIRALVELAKLGQARLDNLFVIGVECTGTFEVEDYASYIGDAEWEADEKEQGLLSDLYLTRVDDDMLPLKSRSACRICNTATPHLGDVTLGLLGMEQGVLVSLDADLAERLGIEPAEEPYSHRSAVEDLAQSRTYRREQAIDEYRDKMKSLSDFADLFATCTRCYACQSSCPICYCRVCFFRTETFEPESDRFLRWADRDGAVKMPAETLLYHLTRLNHVAASCIGCGACESSCARGIPLATIFQAVGEEVQKKLQYTPGRSLEEELPIATFRKEE